MVESTVSKLQYFGTGTSGPYPITFPYQNNNDWLRASVLFPDGTVQALSYNNDLDTPNSFRVDGTNLFTNPAFAPANIVTILRRIPITQILDLVYGGAFPSEQAERALDKITMILQQLAGNSESGGVPLLFPAVEPSSNLTVLPSPSARRDTVIYFDQNTGGMELIGMDELAQRLLIILGAEAVLPYRVREIGTSYTITPFDSNLFLRVNSAVPAVITVPLTDGFTQSFSMEVSRIGLGSVTFDPAPGVILESVLNQRRIFSLHTSVALRAVGLNRWQIYGDLW